MSMPKAKPKRAREVFEIRPLKWKIMFRWCMRADTLIGSLTVFQAVNGWWRFFQEDNDKQYYTAEQAKEAANRWYISRLKKSLKKASVTREK